MASAEQGIMPVNGNHAAHQQYGDQTYANTSNDYGNSTASAANSTGNAEIPKDEVGWFFVEQYYTILSKNPERLYLFYNKRSQFVSGTEAEKVMTCVGQKAINDRIKELDIQDAKVRVTNVDSQGSGQCIVIQVIGEISNKSQPQRKFVQTFVLAEQTNGYFVLNDIFRYIDEDEDEELEGGDELLQQQQQLAASGYQEAQPPATLPGSGNPTAIEAAASTIDSKLADNAEPALTNGIAGVTDNVAHAEDAPVAATLAEDESKPAPEQVAEIVASETVAEPEKPKAPEATPAASPPKKAADPVKPAAPKTWATMVAANRIALPAAPASSTTSASTTPAPAKEAAKARPTVQTAAATPAPATTTAAAAPAAATAPEPEQPGTPASSGSEWQTAARDHGKKQGRAQSQSAAANEGGDKHRGYIKNVSENVSATSLKDALAKVAEVTYFDINRAKVSKTGAYWDMARANRCVAELCIRRLCNSGRLPGGSCSQPARRRRREHLRGRAPYEDQRCGGRCRTRRLCQSRTWRSAGPRPWRLPS